MTQGIKALRPKDAAAKLGVKVRTLYQLRKRPDFPKSIQITDRVFCFSEAELDAWMESRRAS